MPTSRAALDEQILQALAHGPLSDENLRYQILGDAGLQGSRIELADCVQGLIRLRRLERDYLGRLALTPEASPLRQEGCR